MAELETQVVKIQLGDLKQATSYVFTLAEKMDASDSELYMICELPLFNPAASAECERIAQAVASSLKRSYRKPITSHTFENALAEINEELGKLVSMGKTHWIGKLNAVIAVKYSNILAVASAGKISAQLLRDGQFTQIAESVPTNHPLKTFENFSEGKLRLGDLLVLSTTQLFNHISVDRIKNILRRNNLPDAAQEIIGTLQDAMGPEAACGTILALQAEPGSISDEEVDLAAYLNGPQIESVVQDQNWLDRMKAMSATATTISRNMASDMKDKLRKRPKLSELLRRRGDAAGIVQNQFKRVGKQLQPQTIKSYSRQKKFFLISAVVLLVILGANIAIAKYYQAHKKQTAQTVASIDALQKLADDANAAILYGDEAKAADLLGQLQSQLSNLTNVPADQKEAVDKIRAQADDLSKKINKVAQASVETLGTLGNADRLIVLSNYLATETNRTVVSYNRSTGAFSDGALKVSEPVFLSAALKNDKAAIYNGKELLMWDTKTGIVGGAFSDSVPSQDAAVGMRVYSTNSKVYMIDKAGKRVMSYATSDTGFSKPSESIKDVAELANASDLAIDGNIYIATGGTILKYNSGAKQEFNPGVSNLSNSTKLYTQVDFKSLYVLDPGNKRIVIMDKTGKVLQTLNSDSFNDLKDFTVDEKNKTAYVLNNNTLLKVKF